MNPGCSGCAGLVGRNEAVGPSLVSVWSQLHARFGLGHPAVVVTVVTVVTAQQDIPSRVNSIFDASRQIREQGLSRVRLLKTISPDSRLGNFLLLFSFSHLPPRSQVFTSQAIITHHTSHITHHTMRPSTPIKHTCVGSFTESGFQVPSSISRHQTSSSIRSSLSPHTPASLTKTPKTIQNTKQSQKNFLSCSFTASPSTASTPHMRPQMATTSISTPKTRSFFASAVSSSASPTTPHAPLRRQGCAHPRFAAFDSSLEWVRPPLPLTPLTNRLQFAEVFRRLAASRHSPCSASSSSTSLSFPLAPESPPLSCFSGSSRSTPFQLTHSLDLCPQGLARWEASRALESGMLETIESWVLDCPSPFSCESAVASPVASSVTDPWSPRSISTETVSSGSPLAHRLPILPKEHTLLGTLIGKRCWRFSSFLKRAYLNTLHRDDPHGILHTPDNVKRTEALHKWLTDIPTPVIPSPVQARSLSSSPSLFSSSPMSPLISSSSSDSLSFLSRDSSPVASPSVRSPLAASVHPEQPSPVVDSPQNPNLTDALLKLKLLLEAGPPVTRSSPPSPSVASSVKFSFSPARSCAPSQDILSAPHSVSPAIRTSSPVELPTTHQSPADTHFIPPPPPTRSLKRKLPQDASPPPHRTRPAVTRFEPPTPVFLFSPALPESIPSFPIDTPAMPGTFPTDLPSEIHLKPTPVTPSNTTSSVSWKAVAGIAVGAFALGLAVSRYLF